MSSIGTDGSLPTDRISWYGSIDETWEESNIFGGLDAKEVIERLIVCDGQPTRGFRKTLYNDQLMECGIFTGHHSSHDNIIQLDYVKKLLQVGEAPSINIQTTDEIPKEIIEKLEKVGIDKSKIKIHSESASIQQSKVKKLVESGIKTPSKVSKRNVELFSPSSSKLN